MRCLKSKGLFGKAPHEKLICFLLKNDFSKKYLAGLIYKARAGSGEEPYQTGPKSHVPGI